MKKLFAGIAILFTVFMFSGCVLNYQDYNNPNATYIKDVFYTLDDPYSTPLASCHRETTLISGKDYYFVCVFRQPVHKGILINVFSDGEESEYPYSLSYRSSDEYTFIASNQKWTYYSGMATRTKLGFQIKCDDGYKSSIKTITVSIRQF